MILVSQAEPGISFVTLRVSARNPKPAPTTVTSSRARSWFVSAPYMLPMLRTIFAWLIVIAGMSAPGMMKASATSPF